MGYFLPYQERWINDDSPLKIYEKSRRIGITYGTSFRCVIKCVSEPPGSTFTQWVSSRDEMTAKEFVTDYVAMWAKEANKIARELADGLRDAIGLDGKNVEVVDEKRGITAFVVRFKNGSRICSLSSNPLAFAGKGGDILLDEMDLHEYQETLYSMAYPCITWGGQLEIVSAYSADGTEDTTFARLCRGCREEGNPMGFSVHRTTLDDAIGEGFVEKVNEVKQRKGKPSQTREEFRASIRRGCLTQGAFDSQFNCIPNRANGSGVVSKADLAAAKSEFDIVRLDLTGDGGELDVTDPCVEPYSDAAMWKRTFAGYKRLALGWDIAVTGDLGSIWVNGEYEERWKLLTCITFKRCKIKSQAKVVSAMMDGAPRLVGCGDKSGIGWSECTELELKYYGRFLGMMFGGSTKIAVITVMQAAYEQHHQMLPLMYPEIPADIAALKMGKTAAGKLTYIHTKNELLPDSHCDVAISNALAVYAGETMAESGEFFMCPANPAQEVNVTIHMTAPPDDECDARPDNWGY